MLGHRLDATSVSYEQWLAMGETNLPTEVVDGRVIVTPPPGTLHQRALTRLAVLLSAAVPGALEVLVSPIGWVMRREPLHVREPDIAVVKTSAVGGPLLEQPPALAVEILSPSTRERDTVTKRSLYAETGLAWYWLVDLDIPQILVLRNVGERFVEHASAVGEDVVVVHEPFPVQVAPVGLIRAS